MCAISRLRPLHGGDLSWAAVTADCPVHSILDFSANINPLGPPKTVMSALQKALSTICHYPEPSYRDLRSRLAEIHGLDSDWIGLGNGAAELFTWAAREFSLYSANVIYMTPSFAEYTRAFGAFGVTARSVPLSIFDPRSDSEDTVRSVLQILRTSQTQFGVWLNNPHNPTGRLWSQDDLFPLLHSGGLVLVDEAFMDFVEPSKSLLNWVSDFPNLIVVRSLTKFYSFPGLRLGYVVTHPERNSRWRQWRDAWPINSLAVAAGLAAVDDFEFQKQTLAWLPKARQALWSGLRAIPELTPLQSATNFLLIKTSVPGSLLQRELLLRAQILVRDCLSFPELGEDYIRVAVREEPDNERLLSALGLAMERLREV
ncbi:MAG: threonine-phosphate decarboxylase CobD [Cyanobacteria bacterium P01_H01_bin.15]